MKTAKAPPKTKALLNGSNGASAHEVVQKVEAGVKFRELETLRARLGLPLEEMGAKLGISRATLHRRKIAGRLDLHESDRVMRFERLVEKAAQVFGSAESAREWLSFPQYGLGGVIPLDYARTEAGAREVEHLLGRIEWGVFS